MCLFGIREQTFFWDSAPPSTRYGLFRLLDHRSEYGQGVLPEPFLADDSDLETNEARLTELSVGDEPTGATSKLCRLISHLTDKTVETAQATLARQDSTGQRRMLELQKRNNGRRTREALEISPDLWAGVGLMRGGAGTALVGSADKVAARILEYHALGIDTFILSGYPHLEEAYQVAELLFPRLAVQPEFAARAQAKFTGPLAVDSPGAAPDELATPLPANEGSIQIGGVPVRGPNRNARLMFQDSALLPWQTVLGNVALAASRTPDGLEEAGRALQLVALKQRANDWPSIFSGGQRQRVALARALASKASVLLLDEPLGALDALTRLEMQKLIEEIWLREKFTAVLVTHDVEEAVALADRALVMEEGRIIAEALISLSRPRNRSSHEFITLRETLLDWVMNGTKNR